MNGLAGKPCCQEIASSFILNAIREPSDIASSIGTGALYPSWHRYITQLASGFTRASPATSLNATPSHPTSFMLHFVTQLKSHVILIWGSFCMSSNESLIGFSTRPPTFSDH